MRRWGENCKANYAGYVRINMSARADNDEVENDIIAQYIPVIASLRGDKVLDNCRALSIIIFTHTAACTCVPDARKRCQTRHSPATRNSKSAASRGHRSPVCPGQFLRSQRSGPGQVRDAAARAEREPFGNWRSDGFRFLPALLLSSAGSLPGAWGRRPGTPQTGPHTGAQTDRRGLGLPRRNTQEGAIRAGAGTGALDRRAVWDQGASTQHRTQPAASSKKTPLDESGDPRIAGSDLTAQYEQLRREATSCSEHAAQGLGLALFLRHGMTAWMQAWSHCSDSATDNQHPRPATPASVRMDLRTQIATLLAGIILGLQLEEPHEWDRT
jgi:hypothetical protein